MDFEQILGAFGVTGDTATTTALALADPSSANLQAVIDAYGRNGQTPPAQLMGYLIQQNEQRYPNDLYRGRVAPWLFFGAAAIFLLYKLSKSR